MTFFRRRGRIAAFQAVFTMDLRGFWELKVAEEVLSFLDPPLPESSYQYALKLLDSFLKNRHEVDAFVALAHPEWRIERMPSEDRNLLRLSITELWYHPDVPFKTVINEWLEIAKDFATESFPPLLNALLDRAYRERRRPLPNPKDSLAGR
jgi:N utilization substance protein B